MTFRLRTRDGAVLALGAAVVATGVLLALLKPPASPAVPPAHGSGPEKQAGGPRDPAPADNQRPGLRGFVGDLKRGGQLVGRDPRGRDVVEPFVIGDSMKLQVEASGVAQICWRVNGRPVGADGGSSEIWTPVDQAVYFDIDEAGDYAVEVEGRGADGASLGRLNATVHAESVKILSFEPFMNPEADRYLTGSDLWLQVDMVEPLRDVAYEFRYLVNGQPVKNPEDGLEWSESDTFPMTFEKAGRYKLAVEVRRAGQAKVEAQAPFATEVVVGDALVDSLDTLPEDARVGSEVTLQAFVLSTTDEPQCRFGVKDLRPNQDFVWLKNDQGQEWGDERRVWIPAQAGNFRVRVEVRPDAEHPASDAREVLYVVTRGAAEF